MLCCYLRQGGYDSLTLWDMVFMLSCNTATQLIQQQNILLLNNWLDLGPEAVYNLEIMSVAGNYYHDIIHPSSISHLPSCLPSLAAPRLIPCKRWGNRKRSHSEDEWDVTSDWNRHFFLSNCCVHVTLRRAVLLQILTIPVRVKLQSWLLKALHYSIIIPCKTKSNGISFAQWKKV